MAKSEYRQRYEARLKDADAKQQSLENQLRSKGPGQVNQADLENLPFVKSNSAVRRLVEIVNNKREKPETRAIALDKISMQVTASQELMEWVLGILKDSEQPGVLRLTALKVLQQSSFKAVIFNPVRAEYFAVLKAITEEPTGVDVSIDELVVQALEILALANDSTTEQKLMHWLKNPAESKIQPEKIIQLLGHDIHADAYPIFREIVVNPPNLQSKIEAIRLLAGDPGAKGLLQDVLNNRQEQKEIRAAAAISYQALDPKAFEILAKNTILNETEDDDLRSICLSALAQQALEGHLESDSEFDNNVNQLREKPVSDALKKSSSQYIKNIKSKK